jgi:hypothetical protein
MTVENPKTYTHVRLRVVTEDEPGAIGRLLGYFQNLNITPRRSEAEFATTGLVHIQIDVCGMSEARLTLITAKVAQHVPVVNAYWHRL